MTRSTSPCRKARAAAAGNCLLDTNVPDQEKRPSFKFGDHYQVTGRSLLLFLMQPKRAASGTGRRR